MILKGERSKVMIIWGNIPFHIHKSNTTIIAKVGDRESRRDSWFKNHLVYILSHFLFLQRAVFKEETDFYNVIFGVAMCQLRLLSFAIDYCQNSNEEKGEDGKKDVYRWSFYDVMVYTFYLPLFIGGPVLTYDRFRNQVSCERKKHFFLGLGKHYKCISKIWNRSQNMFWIYSLRSEISVNVDLFPFSILLYPLAWDLPLMYQHGDDHMRWSVSFHLIPYMWQVNVK